MKAGLTYILFVLFCLSSCNFRKPHKEVDLFYTTINFGQFPTIPLIKPLTLLYDPDGKRWSIEDNYGLKRSMYIDSLIEIGVDKTYIYGKLFARQHSVERYNIKDYVFVDRFGTLYSSAEEATEIMKDKVRVYPTDSIHKTFIIPERWFIINTADSTTEAFFSRSEYQDYLKEKGLSNKMYDIEQVDKVFRKTGIAPWFPDDIKIKLTKQ